MINKNFYPVIISLLGLMLASCQSVPLIRLPQMQDSLTAEEHNDLGVVYEEKNLGDLARKEYLKAVEKRPDWAVPYFNLANLYWKQKDPSASERYYKKALELRPDYPDCLNNLAWLCYAQKRYGEALKYIDRALLLEKKQEYLDTRKKIQSALK